MIRITGRTFAHKDALKEMGARFDGDTKEWYIDRLRDVDRAAIKRMVGVMLVEQQPEPIQPRPLRSKTIEQVLADILSDDDDKPKPRVKSDGKSNIHGDDRTYFNAFADQNPISYFGFSSLSKIVEFVEAMKPTDFYDRQWEGWKRERTGGWFGTPTMKDALKLATFGWPEGVEMAEDIREKLVGRNATQRRRKYNVVGGSVSIGRMLAHNPMHMVSRPKQPGKKNITLYVEGFISSSINQDHCIIRAAVTAAIADILEMNGFRCEIVSITTALTYSDKPAYQVATTLKAAGDALNINDIVFALGHPSYFRRLVFGTLAHDRALERIWDYMGMPSAAFDRKHPLKANEIYVKQIKHVSRDKVDSDASMMKQAMQIWDLVTDKELPITLNREDD